MIKVILFDVGGVYMKGSFIDFVNRSYKILGINKDFHTDKEVIFDSDYNKGIVTVEECFRKYFKVPIAEEQMRELIGIWTTTWKPLDKMVRLVKDLKKNYRVAVLSNSDLANSDNYTKKGWYDPFEVLILSHELGILKPDKKIYEITLEKLKASPEACLFIDDQEECLTPAAAIGMKTILFRSIGQLKEEFKKIGIRF